MRCRLLIFISLSFASSLLRGQGASDGNDFYLGLLYPSYNTVSSQASNYSVVALVSSLEDNTISVSYFDPISGEEEAPTLYKVTALNSTSIPLNIQRMKMPKSEVSEYRSVHIRGKKKISVQYFSSGTCSGGAYLGLPSNVLGRKYVVASHNDNPEGIGALVGGQAPSSYDIGCGEFVVVATENGTNVTITMRSESEGGIQAGGVRTIVLNRGQCYLVRSKCSSNDADISGSIVESDRPVAVISGHSNAVLGSVGDHIVEGRDYMIEQMIPGEYWDVNGYDSFSFKTSSQPAINAPGETYRAYTFDSVISNVVMQQMFGKTTYDISSSRFHPGEKIDVEGGYTFGTKSGMPFMVCQYDQTSHTELNPHPRPSMSQLIPRLRYRRNYHFVVPKKTFETAQEDYIFISGPTYNLWVSKDGKGSTSIESAGFKKFKYPQYYGTLYQVLPGSYVVGSYSDPFMVYQFGFRRMTNDERLGDYDGDDNFTSYAMPAGVLLPIVEAVNLRVTIDTFCNGWNVSVKDPEIEGGIMSVELINDPRGQQFPRPQGQWGYEPNNIGFDSAGVMLRSLKLNFNEDKSTVCFTLRRPYTNHNASAPILITNSKGNILILDLEFRTGVSYYNKNGTPFNGLYQEKIPVAFEKDTVIAIVNNSNSTIDQILRSVTLKDPGSAFEITNLSEQLPARLKPGQSLRVTLRMRCVDTMMYTSSLVFADDCAVSEFPLSIKGVEGVLSASDVNYGDTKLLNKPPKQQILIKNVGSKSFTLLHPISISDTVNFLVDIKNIRYNGDTITQLPLELLPESYATVDVDFRPRSHGYKHCLIQWATDISSNYSLAGKTTSTLSGTVFRYGVYWDKDELHFQANERGQQRIDLVNGYESSTSIDGVRISGVDAAEFKISNSESSLNNFMLITNDRDWYSIEFIPDMKKPLSDRYKMRSANLEAIVADTIVSTPLFGDVSKLQVEREYTNERFTLEHQFNSAVVDEVVCRVNVPLHLEYEIYSILGKKVLSIPSFYFDKGKHVLQIPAYKISEGSYILRASDGTFTKSISFRVVKP
jgi:hypothetical protein